MAARVIQGFFVGGRMQPPRLPPHVVQRAPLSLGGSDTFEIDPVQLGLVHHGGQPLPQTVLAKMEEAFGADFSSVRVHVGPQAQRIGAVAFTTGNDIYFAPGRYQPDTSQGQHLLGHELAHVVQQRQGRVRAPSMGVAVVQDRMLEAEADRMGTRAANFQPPSRPAAVPAAVPAAIQRQVHDQPGIVQLRGGHPKKHWTKAQHEQSRKFWERKAAKQERQEAARIAALEVMMLRTQRTQVSDVVESDEVYFRKYLKERTGAPKKVYRGDGRGMDQNSLANLTNVQGITAQGTLDLTFAGAVRHVCSNTDPGGVISTTADIDCAVHFAINSHPYGLVYEMEVTDYVDMCKVLSDRNFKNRYEAQKEFIVPKRISKAQIKKVMLYRKGGVPNDIWTSGTLLAYRNVNHGTLGDVVVVQQ